MTRAVFVLPVRLRHLLDSYLEETFTPPPRRPLSQASTASPIPPSASANILFSHAPTFSRLTVYSVTKPSDWLWHP